MTARTTGTPIHLIVGTSPEAVKVAPVALALRQHSRLVPVVVDTGQQPGMVDQALAGFGLSADVRLGVRRSTGSLAELSALAVTAVDEHLAATEPAAVLVQGDTLTTLMAGMAAFWRRIPVVHLEAGLRTGDLTGPFPEEANRAMLARVAALHLPPTPRAKAALAAEGITGDHVVVTGNTAVDALHAVLAAERVDRTPGRRDPDAPLLVVTVHRREAWGTGVGAVCTAVRTALDRVPHARAVVVTHPNPAVQQQVHDALGGHPRVEVSPPLPYAELIALLCTADLALTDSGGLQEEAPSLGLPLLVAREVTERQEGVVAGAAVLVGLDERRITAALVSLLADPAARARMVATASPFGDGHAAGRVVAALDWLLAGAPYPREWAPDVEPTPPTPIRPQPAEWLGAAAQG